MACRAFDVIVGVPYNRLPMSGIDSQQRDGELARTRMTLLADVDALVPTVRISAWYLVLVARCSRPPRRRSCDSSGQPPPSR